MGRRNRGLLLILAAGLCLAGYAAAARPTAGVLIRVDYEYPSATGVDPNQAGWQCADTTSSAGATRGNLTATKRTYDSGDHSGLFVDPPTNRHATYFRSACEVLVSHTIKTGQDIYFAMALRFPPGWSGHDTFDSRVSVAFLDYIAIFGPIEVDAYTNRVALSIDSGNCSYATGCEYDNSCGGECLGARNNVRCAPVNSINPDHGVNGCKIIPSGDLTLGVWHQIIIHVRETPRADGLVEAWWRRKGESGWKKTVTMSGMPTLELGTDDFGHDWTASDYDNGVTGEVDKFGLQDRNLLHAVSINQDDDCVATSFSAAASCFG